MLFPPTYSTKPRVRRFPRLLVYRVHNIHGEDMQQWIHYGAARSQQCIVCANMYIQQFSIMGMLARNPFIISMALAVKHQMAQATRWQASNQTRKRLPAWSETPSLAALQQAR
jgi:hypothetical protein